jgi:hypothetical protein
MTPIICDDGLTRWVPSDAGRNRSTTYRNLKPAWVRRGGMRFKIRQDCAIIALANACDIPYDDAAVILRPEPNGGVRHLDEKIEGKTIGGWRIERFHGWPSGITRIEFTRLFPTGRFLCGEHGHKHLTAYKDGVRWDNDRPYHKWTVDAVWQLTRAPP